jgi:hypothetical protein
LKGNLVIEIIRKQGMLLSGLFLFAAAFAQAGCRASTPAGDQSSASAEHRISSLPPPVRPAPITTLGVFRPAPALSLYVVGDGQPCPTRLVVRRRFMDMGDRLMLRVFDPDEKLMLWQYLEPGRLADTEKALGPYGPGGARLWGAAPIKVPEPIDQANDLLADANVTLTRAGVHQIRVTAGSWNSGLAIAVPRPLPFGVSFQNGPYYPWDSSVAKTFVYIPPHAEYLKIQGEGVCVRDENGQQVFPGSDYKPQAMVTVPIQKTRVIWTFEFPDPKTWSFSAAGFPVILCSDEKAAETIHASVIELPDGTVVCHQFQVRIAEILPKLLAPENVGKPGDFPLPLNGNKEAWLENPVRNSLLLESYNLFPVLFKALTQQNLDSASHWSGSMGFEAWKDKAGKPPPENRWDRFHVPPGCAFGASGGNGEKVVFTDYGGALARAAFLDVPFNPYFGRKELLYRAAAVALRDLMTLPEDEVWFGTGDPGNAETNPYPGFTAFAIPWRNFPEYSLVAPYMPEEVRSVWTEGLQHVFDRHYPDFFVACMNQSAHYLAGWEMFAEGTQDPRYRDLARQYADRFARDANPGGYCQEACGPDCSYAGIQHWFMAVNYRMSGNPVMLEAVRKSYNFFNHTVAPEPDGNPIGGFNFAHRTPGGFQSESWRGARGILDDVLPEVGLWSGAPRSAAAAQTQKEAAARKLSEQLDQPLGEGHEMLEWPRYQYWTDKPDRSRPWPAQEAASFIRDIGGELVAIKRPAYYTAIYTGHPAPFLLTKEILRRALPFDMESAGANPWDLYPIDEMTAATPFVGGGLTLFWMPKYGNALLAANCSPLCHHGLVSVDKTGQRWWEDYYAASRTLDKEKGELTVTGQLEKQPVRYERHYRFNDQSIEIRVVLTASEDVAFAEMFENLPVLGGTVKINGAEIQVEGEKPEPSVAQTAAAKEAPPVSAEEALREAKGKDVPRTAVRKSSAQASRFAIVDKLGNGVDVILDSERPLRICRSGMGYPSAQGTFQMQFNRVQVMLPAELKKGQPVEIKYRLVPRTANSSQP